MERGKGQVPGLLGAWNPSPSHFVEQLRSLKADDFCFFCCCWGWHMLSVGLGISFCCNFLEESTDYEELSYRSPSTQSLP